MSLRFKAFNWLGYTGIILFIVTINIFRFTHLEESPPGFHVDELSTAVTVQCLATEGIDALEQKYPLFSDVNYGSPKPPTYIYPAILWTKISGYSIPSFRGFCAFIGVLAIIGLIFLGRVLFGWRYGLLCAFVASVSPWWFQVTRLNMEGALAPCFIVWGLYFFLRSQKISSLILAGTMFACAAYSYPPTRLHLALFFPPMMFFKYKWHGFSWKSCLVFLASCIITSIPLIIGVISGGYMKRFSDIGILSEKYFASIGQEKNIFSILTVFAKNFFVHLNPNFYLLRGDKNLIYSNGYGGIISWVEASLLVVGILFFVFSLAVCYKNRQRFEKKEIYFIGLLIVGMLTAIVPSALTWQDIPHAYRVIGLWSFWVLLLGFILHKITLRWHFLSVFFCVCAIIFMRAYLIYSFKIYPKRAHHMFNGYSKDLAAESRDKNDWNKFLYLHRGQNFHTQYYLMNYRSDFTCSSSRALWLKLHQIK